MRRLLALLIATALGCMVVPVSSAGAARSPQHKLSRALSAGLTEAGGQSGAYVVDLATGKTLFAEQANAPRLPASVEKLYTTATALVRFGPSFNLLTRVYGTGSLGRNGTWHGSLYVRGGGDPSFGSHGFDDHLYGGGTGATMRRLVVNLVRATGIKALDGRIVGDESYLDSLRGTIATDFESSAYVEGQLSGLAYDRGFTSLSQAAFQSRPALYAAQQFEAALRTARVRVSSRTAVISGDTPRTARLLTVLHSPSMTTLVRLTNAPSDNFFAEMLLKDIGAQFGAGGTTADGAAVVRAQIASSFGIHPSLDDGSGLSHDDHSTPAQVVALLERMSHNPSFTGSLAVAGESGTLVDEMRDTSAQGRCRGKTGTLDAVSNLVGYCTAHNGDTLAFAFLMNSIDPNYAHPIQDRMAVALSKYR